MVIERTNPRLTLVRVVIAGYFRSINVFHTGVTIDQRTSTYVNRAVDKFRLDVVRASNKLRVLSDPTRPTRSAILENRRMRNLPLRYLHIHTTMFASSAQLSTASLSLCPSIWHDTTRRWPTLHSFPDSFVKLSKYMSNTRRTYQREVGILQALILTFIDISYHFFRTSRVYCISLFLLIFAFLTKTTTADDPYTFFFSIFSKRNQQIAEIPGIYVW